MCATCRYCKSDEIGGFTCGDIDSERFHGHVELFGMCGVWEGTEVVCKITGRACGKCREDCAAQVRET